MMEIVAAISIVLSGKGFSPSAGAILSMLFYIAMFLILLLTSLIVYYTTWLVCRSSLL